MKIPKKSNYRSSSLFLLSKVTNSSGSIPRSGPVVTFSKSITLEANVQSLIRSDSNLHVVEPIQNAFCHLKFIYKIMIKKLLFRVIRQLLLLTSQI